MSKEMQKVSIHTDYIQLDQLLKWIGITSTGGQVKVFIDTQSVLVNNVLCEEKRKKIKIGDIVEIKNIGSYIIVKEGG